MKEKEKEIPVERPKSESSPKKDNQHQSQQSEGGRTKFIRPANLQIPVYGENDDEEDNVEEMFGDEMSY